VKQSSAIATTKKTGNFLHIQSVATTAGSPQPCRLCDDSEKSVVAKQRSRRSNPVQSLQQRKPVNFCIFSQLPLALDRHSLVASR